MNTLLLLPVLLSQALPTIEVRNLQATYRSGASQGLMTLADGFLVLSEPRTNGRSRTLAYDSRGGLRLLGQSTLPPTRYGHDRLGALVVTTGSESVMGDLNGDGDALDLCAVALDLASGANLAPRAILTPDASAPWNPVLARDLVGLVLTEAGEQSDLNGDGHQNDFIVSAWRPSTGQFAVTRPSVRPFAFDGAIGFLVGESRHDFTGDGDRWDNVYFVHELASGTTVNTHLAVAPGNLNVGGQSTGGRTLVFAASEADTGRDLDGDGLLTRDLLHAYSLDRGTLENLGATGPTFPYKVADHWVAFVRREVDAGDLNGDGDALDVVLHVYSGASGAIQNLALATVGPLAVLQGASAVGFAVDERTQGVDLNADGDQLDLVAHVLDLATGSVLNTALAGQPYEESFFTPESSNGRDLNGDGDLDDSVPHLLADGPFPAVTLGIAGSSVHLSPGRAGLLVSEHYEGRDLDGDGDQADFVLHGYKRSSGVLENLGLVPVGGHWEMDARLALVPLDEGGVNDWNRDGDADDDVLHLVDLERGTRLNLALAVRPEDPIRMSADLWAVVVSESGQGVDLNGNGQIQDGVVHVIDPHRALRR